MANTKSNTDVGARFGAAASATRASEIARLSPVERKARGLIRARDDARMAQERAEKAAAAATERAEGFAAQAEELEAELAELPDPADSDDETE